MNRIIAARRAMFSLPVLAAFLVWDSASADEHAGAAYVPYKASSIYAQGETVGWNVTLLWSSPTAEANLKPWPEQGEANATCG